METFSHGILCKVTKISICFFIALAVSGMCGRDVCDLIGPRTVPD